MDQSAYDQFLPISALQHLVFCERQCALIHIEREWRENRLTTEGAILHKRAHAGPAETRQGIRIARGVDLVSRVLGLRGVADVVEFRSDGRVTPVEYKRGRPKRGDEDRVQLCAQALCLEEMLGVEIRTGTLFYGRIRRRVDVELGPGLRDRTNTLVVRLHALIASRETPAATLQPKCRRCSLKPVCLPGAIARSVRRGYLRARAREVETGGVA